MAMGRVVIKILKSKYETWVEARTAIIRWPSQGYLAWIWILKSDMIPIEACSY